MATEKLPPITAAGNLTIACDIKKHNMVRHCELIVFKHGPILYESTVCVPVLSLRPLFHSLCLYHLSSIFKCNPPGEVVYYHCVMTVQ